MTSRALAFPDRPTLRTFPPPARSRPPVARGHRMPSIRLSRARSRADESIRVVKISKGAGRAMEGLGSRGRARGRQAVLLAHHARFDHFGLGSRTDPAGDRDLRGGRRPLAPKSHVRLHWKSGDDRLWDKSLPRSIVNGRFHSAYPDFRVIVRCCSAETFSNMMVDVARAEKLQSA